MFGLKPEVIENIRNVLGQYPEIDEAVLYGSRAKGNYTSGSDIDLTIKGEEVDLSVVSSLGSVLDDLLLPYTIDISVHHQISNPELVDHIARVGITVYKKPSE